MFIDKLETEDFDGFAKKNLGLPVAEFKRGFCDIYVKLDADSYGPCPEFMFDDFTCRGLNNRLSFCNEERIQKMWRKFMFEKFGEEYKTACNSFLKKQYEDGLIK